jgi:hypothetical protein
MLGAAKSAILQGDNPLSEQHRHWIGAGVSPRNARCNVARSQSAVMWGMWKNGGVYEASRVGVALTHRAHIVEIAGESYRLKQSLRSKEGGAATGNSKV